MAQIKLTVISDTKSATTSISNLKTEISALAKEYEKVSVSQKKAAPVKDAGTAAKSTAANIETLRKSYSNLITQLKTLKGQYDEGTFDKVSASVQRHQKQVVNLSKVYQQNGKLNQQQQTIAQQLSKDYKTLTADVAQLKAENDKLRVSDPFSTNVSDNVARLQKRYQSLLSTIKGAEKYYAKGTFDELTNSIKADVAQLNNLDVTAKSALPTLNKLNSSVLQQEAAFAQAKNSATNYHGTLRDLVSGFLKFQVAAMLVMKPLQLIRSAISSINETLVETEKVVVSLQRVLDEDVEAGEISSELYSIAQNLGQTFDNVQEIAQNFAKAGLSWQDTLKATEAAVLALNVAELTAEESSEGLIAVMQQFNYEASELTYVIDVLNKAADKSAVDTQELLVALQKTGSYASAANLSLEETVGLISALSEATAASGQNIGNALKSLFAYSSKASSLEMFASLSDEMKAIVDMYQIGDASILDVWEKLAETMGTLTDRQADLLEQWSEESGLETELGAELGDVYKQLTGVYDTAGVYRKNYFIALLNNFDEVKEVMGEISDAAGYTAEEQAKYMDTYEAKLNSLQAQWEEFANSEQGLLGLKKGLLDFASIILTVIDYFGGLQTVVLALSTALWVAFGDKIISAIKSFGTALKSLVTGFNAAAGAARGFQAALGWIGIAVTAISAIWGAIESGINAAKQAEEEARQAAYEAWDGVKEQSTELTKLIAQYKELGDIAERSTNQEEEYLNIEEQIVALLGTKAIALSDLTAGTEEYRQKVLETAQDELRTMNLYAQRAANIAQDEFADKEFTSEIDYLTLKEGLPFQSNSYQTTGYYDVIQAAKKADFNFEGSENRDFWTLGGREYHEKLQLGDSTFDQAETLKNFAVWLSENGYAQSDMFNEIVSELETRQEAIDNLLNRVAEAETTSYIVNNGFLDSNEDFDAIVNAIISATDATEEWRDEIERLVTDYSGFNKELDETKDNYDDQIKTLENLTDEHMDELIEKLKEMRDIEEDSNKLEERKRDILEAQQKVLEKQKALEDAKNNRTIRTFNSATGQFEWTVDQEKIQTAEDELAEAQEELNDAIEAVRNEAWDSVIEELESGNATNESVKEILDEWKAVAELQADADISWYKEIVDAIKNISNINIGASDISAVSYDNGGIASGLGYMPKATAEPEAVNDPVLTAKILSPVSNAEFDRYVKDMGILFNTAREYTNIRPVMQSTVGATTNTTNNNSVSINGLKIGTDMLNAPFIEVLKMATTLVPRRK